MDFALCPCFRRWGTASNKTKGFESKNKNTPYKSEISAQVEVKFMMPTLVSPKHSLRLQTSKCQHHLTSAIWAGVLPVKAFLTNALVYLHSAREKTAATTPKYFLHFIFCLQTSFFWKACVGLCTLYRYLQEFEHWTPLGQCLQRQKRISLSTGWTGDIFHPL